LSKTTTDKFSIKAPEQGIEIYSYNAKDEVNEVSLPTPSKDFDESTKPYSTPKCPRENT
jgi:hypothetical protein